MTLGRFVGVVNLVGSPVPEILEGVVDDGFKQPDFSVGQVLEFTRPPPLGQRALVLFPTRGRRGELFPSVVGVAGTGHRGAGRAVPGP